MVDQGLVFLADSESSATAGLRECNGDSQDCRREIAQLSLCSEPKYDRSSAVISTERLLSGWGNYPVEKCHVSRPTTVDSLTAVITQGGQRTYIPRGLGRSYGDSAINRDGGVVLQTCLNRLLAFHEQSGVLECEAGASFAEIITHFLPRGWFLPTTPGTKHVTVGGAIAADVHGKNHHIDGSLCKYVLELTLLTAAGDLIICSPTRNSRVFEATVGGMGLTGVIVSARIQLLKTSTAYLNVDFKRTANLDET